jgi:acyl dehydratase
VLFFEDFSPGQRLQCGAHAITREEIVSFAERFDPVAEHLAGHAAARWHVGALCMRLAVDGVINKAASLGSPGIDVLNFLQPVVPGDTLSCEVEVLETKPSRSKADRGSVRVRYVLHNQRGEAVLDMIGWGMFRRRPV